MLCSPMTSKKQRGRPKHPDILTPGEWRIVQGIRHGMTSKQIAERRNISIDAVKYHVANILEKLNLADRKALRRWEGIHAASPLNLKEPKMTAPITLSQIGQISRTVKNIDLAREWYSSVLGITHLYSFGNLTFFDCQGLRLFLNQSEKDIPEDSILYFHVPDIHAAQKALESKGVEFINAPHMIHTHDNGTEEWMAFFNDLDGRPLGLMTNKKSGADAPLSSQSL